MVGGVLPQTRTPDPSSRTFCLVPRPVPDPQPGDRTKPTVQSIKVIKNTGFFFSEPTVFIYKCTDTVTLTT